MSDWGIILSTLVGPLLAVQATRWLDRRAARASDQRQLFSTLMATRVLWLDRRQVEALNTIDVVFGGKATGEVAVRTAWTAYVDHLIPVGLSDEVWAMRRTDLFTDLLYAMAQHLKFKYDKTHLKTQAYYPRGWSTVEEKQLKIQDALARVADGIATIPVTVYAPPASGPPGAALQRDTQRPSGP